MYGVKPLSGLTNTVVVMMCIYMFVLACSILTCVFELIQYAGYEADVYLEDLLISQILNGLVGIVFLVIYLITAVFFLKWVYRANKNLRILGVGHMDFTPAANVFWYFVPIACFFKPYQAMREIWCKAHKAWTADTRLLPGWWTLWIISTIMGQIVFRQSCEIISEYRLAAITMIVSDLIDIALGFTAIALLSNTRRAFEENYCGAEGAEAEMLEALKVTTRPSDIQNTPREPEHED